MFSAQAELLPEWLGKSGWRLASRESAVVGAWGGSELEMERESESDNPVNILTPFGLGEEGRNGGREGDRWPTRCRRHAARARVH